VLVSAGLAAAYVVLTTPPLRRLLLRAGGWWLGAGLPLALAADVASVWRAAAARPAVRPPVPGGP